MAEGTGSFKSKRSIALPYVMMRSLWSSVHKQERIQVGEYIRVVVKINLKSAGTPTIEDCNPP